MTNRVILSDNGLRISRPGIDVLSAAIADLQFRAEDGSMPVVLKTIVGLNSSLSAVTTIWYGQSFPQVPMSILFWSPGYPSPGTDRFQIGAMGNTSSSTWPVGYSSSNGDTTFFYYEKYNDRITLHSERNFSSGDSPPGLGGCISAVIYDMR